MPLSERRRILRQILSFPSTKKLPPSFEGEEPVPSGPLHAAHPDEEKLRQAMEELEQHQTSRALQKLSSNGILPLTESVRDKLKAKYPQSQWTPPTDLPSEADVPSLKEPDVEDIIRQTPSTKGHGHDGWTWPNLKSMLSMARQRKCGTNADAFLAGLTAICEDIVKGRHTTDQYGLWESLSTTRGIPLRKEEGSDDPRPIGIPSVFLTLAAKALFKVKAVKEAIKPLMGDFQLGIGTSGGVESVSNIVTAFLNLHPEQCVVQYDIRNAFNEVEREHILPMGSDVPAVAPLLHLLYCRPGGNTVVYPDRDGEPLVLKSQRGVTQGGVEASAAYGYAHRGCVEDTMAKHPDVRVVGIADDTTTMGPGTSCLDFMETYAVELAKRGETLQPRKCKLLLGSNVSAADKATITTRAAALGISIVDGLTIVGVPVGSPMSVAQALNKHFAESMACLDMVHRAIQSLINRRQAPLQGLYKIIRLCLAPAKINHLLRALPTDFLSPHLFAYDAKIYELTLAILSLSPSNALCDPTTAAGRLTLARARLSAHHGGLGITSASATALSARRGNLAHTAHFLPIILGPSFDPSTDGEIALPELYKLLPANFASSSGITSLPPTPPVHYFSEPMPKLSRLLNHHDGEAQAKAVLNFIPDAQDRAVFLSGGDDGATFLLTKFASRQALQSEEFAALARARLGLPATCNTPPPGLCHLCAKPCDTSGTHVLECTAAKNCTSPCADTLYDKPTRRHDRVCSALIHSMSAIAKRELGKNILEIKPEPHMSLFNWGSMANFSGPLVDARADLSYALPGGGNVAHVVADLTVTHPNASPSLNRGGAAAASQPGAAAQAAHAHKYDHYAKRYVLPANSFFPLAIETGGRMHESFKNFLRTFVKRDILGANVGDKLGGADLTKYNLYLRELIEAVEIALAKSVAGALMWNRRDRPACAHCPSHGPGDPPHAGAGSGVAAAAGP
jgi:hypothetical protein